MLEYWLLWGCALASALIGLGLNANWKKRYTALLSETKYLRARLEREEDGPPLNLSPEDRMALATMRDYWKHPSRYELVKEASANGLHVTVRRKEKDDVPIQKR